MWMSHGDFVETPPKGFLVTARSDNTPVAAFEHGERPIFGLQFHPEVDHTPRGVELLSTFLFDVCHCPSDWTPGHFVDNETSRLRQLVGPDDQVICGLSGGVDSSVAAVLVHQAIGDRLTCIFVDHGLLRLHEREQVEHSFRQHLGIDLIVVDAAAEFLQQLEGVSDPEEKRRRIGHTFIDVFEREANKLGDSVKFLVQGTLYPDVIESVSPSGGPSATIKTHHNVGGLPERLPFSLIEPLRELFKDEVRQVGRELGLPEEMVARHPFPGPGLAIRILGEVTGPQLDCRAEPSERVPSHERNSFTAVHDSRAAVVSAFTCVVARFRSRPHRSIPLVKSFSAPSHSSNALAVHDFGMGLSPIVRRAASKNAFSSRRRASILGTRSAAGAKSRRSSATIANTASPVWSAGLRRWK